MFNGVFPVFVSVVVPNGWQKHFFSCPEKMQEKDRLAGLSSTTVPVPVKPTYCWVPRALSAIERLAFRELMLVGVNVTLIVQLAPGATELPLVAYWKIHGLPVMLVRSSGDGDQQKTEIGSRTLCSVCDHYREQQITATISNGSSLRAIQGLPDTGILGSTASASLSRNECNRRRDQ